VGSYCTVNSSGFTASTGFCFRDLVVHLWYSDYSDFSNILILCGIEIKLFEYQFMKTSLFGQDITTGPFAIQVNSLKFRDPEGSLKRFAKAETGEAVPFDVEPLVPLSYVLLK